MTEWTDTDPGAGDMESVRRAAVRYRTGASQLRELTQVLVLAAAHAPEVWQGDDMVAWHRNANRDAEAISSDADTAEDIAAAWSFYASEVEWIADRQSRFDGMLSEVEDEARTLHSQRRNTYNPDPDLIARWDRRAAEFEITRSTAHRGIAELAEERRSLDARVSDRITAALDTSAGAKSQFANLGVPAFASSMSGFAAYTANLSDRNAAALADALSKLTPEEAAQAWARLSAAARKRLIATAPELIGNLEGIPYADRDAANVSRLAKLCEETRKAINSSPLDQTLRDRLRALEYLYDNFANGLGRKAHPPQYLIALDATVQGPPLAAISVGNLDTATNATFFVPGMNSNLNEAENYLRAAKNMQQGNPGHAVVLFLNYHSPSPLEVVDGGRAKAGAIRLEHMLDGYNAMRNESGLDSRLNVVGHSFGTTVVALALAHADYRIDSVILVASAGIADGLRAQDLHVDPAHIFTTQALPDWVATTGRGLSFRSDPDDPGWGAKHFGSDGTILPDGTKLDRVDGHNAIGGDPNDDRYKYFGPKTESLRNVDAIIDGRYRDLTQSTYSVPNPQPGPTPHPQPNPSRPAPAAPQRNGGER